MRNITNDKERIEIWDNKITDLCMCTSCYTSKYDFFIIFKNKKLWVIDNLCTLYVCAYIN